MSSALSAAFASPATRAANVTPDDNNDLSFVTRAVYVGGAGSVAAILQDNNTAIAFIDVPAGTVLPIRVKRITTASTATDMVALA